MSYLIILGMLSLSMAVLSILFVIEVTDKILTLIDRVREITKNAAMDGVQVWSSGNMASLDIDRERAKLELTQDFNQVKLEEYKQGVDLKRLKAKSEAMK